MNAIMKSISGPATASALICLISANVIANDSPQQACWGQATKAFAQMGVMGQHASEQPTPRLGLRNLARALADAGVIPDDSIQTLGAFVAAELGLDISVCMSF